MIIRALEDQRLHVVLYGDRGIGKTSTVQVMSNLARQVGYIVRYTSCSEEVEFSDLFRSVLRDVPLLYHADIDPASDQSQAGGTLADLLPSRVLTVSDVTDVLSKLSGTRLLVVLDEFDRSQSVAFRRSVAELIKNLSDRSTRVQLVIAGVSTDLTALIEYIPSIRRNVLAVPMTKMAEAEVRELMLIGSEASGLTYSYDSLTALASAAAGLPYLASLLAQHAGIAALDRNGMAVDIEDVETAIIRAEREVESRVSAQSLQRLRRVEDPALLDRLEKIAGESFGQHGRVAIDGPQIGSDARYAQLDLLTDEYGLLERDPGPESTYRFGDDGVALLVWLRGILSAESKIPSAEPLS